MRATSRALTVPSYRVATSSEESTVAADKIDTIVSLSKRRGFVYPCSEIYGGTRAAWDYGPLGVELKENIKRQWWRAVVTAREDVVGLDSSVILAREVWEASGHVATFNDPLTECTSCHKRYRADHLEEAYEAKHGKLPANGLADINCPHCGTKGAFTEPKEFSGMLKTHLGVTEDAGGLAYLRPETAQGIFTNFKAVQTTSRKKPPFGIAQVGKSFRNEITPGNFIFRTREFEQMEMEFFVKPGEDEKWHEYWLEQRWNWYTDLGLRTENMRYFEHPKEKLSHYAKRTVDIEYRFNFGGSEFSELEGVANRTDYDLATHSEASGQDLKYFDQESGERYFPYVIEPTAASTARCWPSCSTPTSRTRRPTPRASWRSASACGSTPGSPRSRSRCCRCRATPTCRRRPGAWPPTCAPRGTSSSTTRARSASATAARTRSARRSASPSTSTRLRTTRSPSASGTPWRRSASRWTG